MAKLQPGDRTPDVSAPDQNGRIVRLADYIGQRAVVLFFYPKDNTPVCTREACAFRDAYEQFRSANTEVIGVSSDSSQSHEGFARQHRLDFPLLSDGDGALRRAFGVPRTLGLLPGRVTYVIDAQGVIRHIFSAAFSAGAHVREALAALDTARPPA